MENKINLQKYLSENFKNFNVPIEEKRTNFSLVPAGTLALMRLSIRPGNMENDTSVDKLLSQSAKTSALYLKCEYTILSGPYKDRKIWGLIGVYSPKGPEWGNMGRAFIKSILSSANNISSYDTSDRATPARSIANFQDLQDIIFAGRIDIEINSESGEKRNVVKAAILPEHPQYKQIMQDKSDVNQLKVRV